MPTREKVDWDTSQDAYTVGKNYPIKKKHKMQIMFAINFQKCYIEGRNLVKSHVQNKISDI